MSINERSIKKKNPNSPRSHSHKSVSVNNNNIETLEETPILDSVPYAILCVKNRRVVYANRAVLSIFGWDPKELDGEDAGMFYQDHAVLVNLCNAAAQASTGQAPCKRELVCRHKDGTEILCEVSITRKDDKLHNDMIIISHQDIPGHRQANNALKECEHKYKDFFVNASDFLYVHDLEGNFIETNIALKKDAGYSNEKLAAMNVEDLLPQQYKHDFKRYLERIIRNGKDEGLLKIIAQDGSELIIEYRNSLIYDADACPIAVRGSARDITESMRDKKALKESEEKYRTILENIEDGYYEVDLAGRFIFFNDSMCSILGYSREEMKGMTYRVFMDKEDAIKVLETFNKVYKTGQPTKTFDWKLNKKDGSTCIVETSVTLVKDSKGQAAGFRGISRDVTERKQAEDDRISLETKLHQAQKMEVIGTLAGGVAHDLNNILSALVSYPELILLELAEDDSLRKPISAIQRSGEKAAAIVQDLLTLARRGVANMKAVDMYTIIIDYLKSPEFNKLHENHRNVEVDIDCDDNMLPVLGSPFHLSKVIMNLMTNAAESMPGGGTIAIRAFNTCLEEPIKGYEKVKKGDYTALVVSDTGVGISPDDRDKIFEPFYTKKEMGRSGTGLGMTVVWDTIKDHGGYIDIESKQGSGTTISLYLPATTEKIRDRGFLNITDYTGNGEKIIIVDDVEIQRDIAVKIMKKLGYQVIAFASGEETVQYMKNNSADLIVLDMIMEPGMNGLETYRQILELHPGQKVIIASGYSETEQVKEVRRLGAGAYIKKPYLLEQIGMAIKVELDKK